MNIFLTFGSVQKVCDRHGSEKEVADQGDHLMQLKYKRIM